MKLKNKKTGEIGWLYCDHISIPKKMTVFAEDKNLSANHWDYASLAELNEEWEDAPEEPFSTPFYTIVDGKIKHCIFYRERVAGCPDDAWAYLKDDGRESIKQLKAVGLYFETEEEAEKAVEKLKALTKLCKKGFEFNSVEMFGSGLIRIEASIPINEKTTLQERSNITDSLYLLFGGEE